MVNVDELQQKEIENIKGQNNEVDEELIDLESLIVDGKDARIPVSISFPRPDGTTVQSGAKIRPVTSAEWNNAMRIGLNNKIPSTMETELLTYALYTLKGDKFPVELIEEIPVGVATELANKISEISGIRTNKEENMKLVQKMMGF